MKERNKRIARHAHWMICCSHGVKKKKRKENKNNSEKWYVHQPETRTGDDTITMLWIMMLTGVASWSKTKPRNTWIPQYQLIKKKHVYDDNGKTNQVQRPRKGDDPPWKGTTNTHPMVGGALGLMSKSAELHPNLLPCTVSDYELREIWMLGSARILRRLLTL